VLTVATSHTDLALAGLLATLFAGGTAVPPGRPVAEGDRLRRVIDRYRVSVLVAAPRPASLLATSAAAGGARLTGLRTVLLARDRVPARLPAALRGALASGADVLTAWGTAEVGVIATTDRLETSGRDGSGTDGRWGRIGEPLGQHAVRAGQLWCAGPAVTLGYIGRPELDARYFSSDEDGVRWYRTGDQARSGTDGHPMLVDPVQDVEAHLEEWPDVRAARIVPGRDGELVAYLETVSGDRVDEVALAAHLGRRVPGDLLPAVLISVPALPMTSTGVVDRRLLAARARASGRSEGMSSPIADAGVARIVQIFADGLGVATLGPETNLYEVGSTSLEVIRAVGLVESEFDFDVDLNRLLDAPYVQTLIDQYHARHRERV
jgi:acyl-CoA synthetase (AMP-forming)/AMP-acid ligase II